MVMNGKLRRMRKKAVVFYLWHSPSTYIEELRKTTENIIQTAEVRIRDLYNMNQCRKSFSRVKRKFRTLKHDTQ
jgi:hypothetical protein